MFSSISRDLAPGGTAELPLPAGVEAEDLPRGSQLGNYVVQACIGRGAMASVYRAEHCLLHKQVALKVMATALVASAEARQRFLREARAVAAIQHPHVVAITDAGMLDGRPYLVMELLTGEDLEQHLDRHGPLGAEQLAAIALPLVAALAAAHDAGVIHRDLKPGNVFLARHTPAEGAGEEVVPKLLDFGISKFANGPTNLAVTAFDQLMGSPLYLPPEALQGSRELTARSDQYSLGVVLYECITGQAPFFREDLVPLLNAISEGSCAAPRKLRPETPPALENAILRAMSLDPAQRFDHIRDLGRSLLEVADVRTRRRWGSALGAPEALLAAQPAALVLAPADPIARQAPTNVRPPAAHSAPLWRTLSLLAAGAALLAFAFGKLPASSEVVRVARARFEEPRSTAAAEPARPPPVREFMAGSSTPVAVEPATLALARPATTLARPAIGLGAGVARDRRPLAKRASAAESDGELRQLFSAEAAPLHASSGRVQREPAAKVAPAAERVLVNEAPLFD